MPGPAHPLRATVILLRMSTPNNSQDFTDQDIERDLAFAIEIARSAGERVLGLRDTGRWEGSMLADMLSQYATLSSVCAGRAARRRRDTRDQLPPNRPMQLTLQRRNAPVRRT